MVFVSPFWSFFFFNPNNKKPKSANCGGDNGVQLIWFGFFCFFKEKSLIWDVLVQSSGSYSLHTTFLNHSLYFPPFLAYGFFSKTCHCFPPWTHHFLIFILTCSTGHDLGVTLPLWHFCLVVFNTCCQAHLPLNIHVQIFQSVFVFSW